MFVLCVSYASTAAPQTSDIAGMVLQHQQIMFDRNRMHVNCKHLEVSDESVLLHFIAIPALLRCCVVPPQYPTPPHTPKHRP